MGTLKNAFENDGILAIDDPKSLQLIIGEGILPYTVERPRHLSTGSPQSAGALKVAPGLITNPTMTLRRGHSRYGLDLLGDCVRCPLSSPLACGSVSLASALAPANARP